MRRVAIDGYDLTIDGRLGLNLYRDGKKPAVQGGRFGPSEAMRNPAGVEQAVILDRLDGGVGAVERLVPHTYPLAIDGCTRFSRAWTPSGEITTLAPFPAWWDPPPTRIRAMARYRGALVVGAGAILFKVTPPSITPVVLATLDPPDLVESFMEFNGLLMIGTRRLTDGTPGTLYIWDGLMLHKSPGGGGGATLARRQFLVRTYMTINDVGASRLISNDTPYTFRYVAAEETPGPSGLIDFLLDDSSWAGYNPVTEEENYPVGDTSAPITGMAGAPLVMFFAKEDGVYHVGPDGRAARVANWTYSQHPTNGQVFEFSYGGLYASNFRWGLVRVDVANLQVQWQTNACAPGAGLPKVVPSNGWITAFTMDGEWMVVSVWNGLDSYLFYGRPQEITERVAMINLASPQQLNWHGSEGTFYGKRVTRLLQMTGDDDRPLLWVAWEDSLGKPGLSHISLPKYGTPLEDLLMGGPHRFQTNSWLYFPRQDWGDDRAPGMFGGWASVRKVFNRVDLTGEYLERYVTWIDAFMATTGDYRLYWDRALDPENTLWTPVGRFDEGTRVSFVPGQSIQSGVKASLMLHGICEPDKPFVFYGAKLRGTPMLEQSERRTYRVVIGRARKANQGMDSGLRLHQLNELWALQWADPVELLDQYHIPLIVDIEPDMSYEDMTEPNSMEPTIVVTFSCRVLRRPFIWSAGYRWGADIAWS